MVLLKIAMKKDYTIEVKPTYYILYKNKQQVRPMQPQTPLDKMEQIAQ